MYAFGTQGTYYGFISCSDRDALQYMHEILLFELIALFFVILLGISQAFLLPYNRIRGVLPSITVVMAINLIAISYKVLEYPIVLRRDGRFTALEEGSMRNPLFILLFCMPLPFLDGSTYFLKVHYHQKQRLLLSLILVLLTLTGVVVFIINKPVPCFG